MAAVMDVITRARSFATAAHAGQRYGAQPYTVHLEAVVAVLRSAGTTDPDVIAAAWLHDTLEDTDTTFGTLVATFGTRIATLVQRVTDAPGTNRRTRQAATYPLTRRDEFATRIKIADRIANMEAATPGSKHWRMYRGEADWFRRSLYTPWQNEDMWARWTAAHQPNGG